MGFPQLYFNSSPKIVIFFSNEGAGACGTNSHIIKFFLRASLTSSQLSIFQYELLFIQHSNSFISHWDIIPSIVLSSRGQTQCKFRRKLYSMLCYSLKKWCDNANKKFIWYRNEKNKYPNKKKKDSIGPFSGGHFNARVTNWVNPGAKPAHISETNVC